MTETVGIRLLDGPLGPYTQLYGMEWPPPDEVVVFEHEGLVGHLALVVNPEHFDLAVSDMGGQRYRKVAQGVLPEPHQRVARGATYEWIEPSP